MGNKSVSQSRSNNIATATDRGKPNVQQPESPATLVFSVVDGRLKELKQPITAGEIAVPNVTTFIASSESMDVGWHIPHMASDEVLQPGQLYFLLPISFSLRPLPIHDLCDMAVKVAAALGVEQRSQQGGNGKGNVNSMEANRCYPIPDVTHLVDKMEKLKLRSGTCRK